MQPARELQHKAIYLNTADAPDWPIVEEGSCQSVSLAGLGDEGGEAGEKDAELYRAVLTC